MANEELKKIEEMLIKWAGGNQKRAVILLSIDEDTRNIMVDYEKKYKEVLGHAKRAIENIPDESLANWLKNIFPELKEIMRGDTREELISFLEELSKLGRNTNFDKWTTFDCAKWIEWVKKQDPTWFEEELEKAYKCADKVQYWKGYNDAKYEVEKQGEQKDKVETIYKIGDFVHCTTINGFEYTYIYKSNHGEVIHAFVNYSCGTHGVVSIDDTLFEPSIITKRKATTEEIVTLLQSINKNGFIWDAEKKELKKIEI